MLAKRIIPCLDVDKGRVVKGTKFVNLKDAGDPVEIAKRYNEEGADELVFLDISATNEKRKNATGEYITETTWHNLVFRGKHAEIVEKHVEKGKEILVEGKIINRSYEDKNGDKRYITEIQVLNFKFLGGRN